MALRRVLQRALCEVRACRALAPPAVRHQHHETSTAPNPLGCSYFQVAGKTQQPLQQAQDISPSRPRTIPFSFCTDSHIIHNMVGGMSALMSSGNSSAASISLHLPPSGAPPRTRCLTPAPAAMCTLAAPRLRAVGLALGSEAPGPRATGTPPAAQGLRATPTRATAATATATAPAPAPGTGAAFTPPPAAAAAAVAGGLRTMATRATAAPEASLGLVRTAWAAAPTTRGVPLSRHFASGPGKKTKIKPYSSLKRRFKILASGEIKCWRAGKRHNASSKTPKQRRQLRRPSVVSPGLARPMRLLNFHGKM